MRRHVWLVLGLAALFGLRAPLCEVACLVTAAPPAAEQPACHGSTPEAPERPTSRHHACACDEMRAFFTKAEGEKPAGALDVVRVTLATTPVGCPVPPTPHAPCQHDLPPPDPLLLHSTLLL